MWWTLNFCSGLWSDVIFWKVSHLVFTVVSQWWCRENVTALKWNEKKKKKSKSFSQPPLKVLHLLHFWRFMLRGLIYINCTIRLLTEYQLLIKHANQLSHALFCYFSPWITPDKVSCIRPPRPLPIPPPPPPFQVQHSQYCFSVAAHLHLTQIKFKKKEGVLAKQSQKSLHCVLWADLGIFIFWPMKINDKLEAESGALA